MASTCLLTTFSSFHSRLYIHRAWHTTKTIILFWSRSKHKDPPILSLPAHDLI
ncbi:hypothetical protein BCR43DRAFT_487298 [Syncephalastrum racemosum]|uniref:Uncharacterized protein n=1 Tax=Syncephalastrum racemosum TaxID=13706 RepID=A0A1X2HQJ8_SYNRA|nr:hypothetical protein BCR43DRAFT_487298 [Syncephalastrum racemosum]